MGGAAHERHKVAQLLCYCLKHRVFIVLALLPQERHQLPPRPLLAQRKRDSFQPPNAVELQLHVIVLEEEGGGERGRVSGEQGGGRLSPSLRA